MITQQENQMLLPQKSSLPSKQSPRLDNTTNILGPKHVVMGKQKPENYCFEIKKPSVLNKGQRSEGDDFNHYTQFSKATF